MKNGCGRPTHMLHDVQQNEFRIGITGSRGFIGSYLTSQFEKKGIRYISFMGDLLNTSDVKAYFKQFKIDKIIHLAGAFSGSFNELLKRNVQATQNLLEIGISLGLKKIIYASSAAVYGNSPDEGSSEDDPLNPNTSYGLTKEYAEGCIAYYHSISNLSYVILRFSNVYGEGNKKGVIYNFLHDIKSKGGITINGNGFQKRNFLHVSDACNALYKAIGYDENNTFNVGSDKSMSLNNVIDIFKKYYSFKINYMSSRDSYNSMVIDIRKIKDKLSFIPNNELEDYIKKLNK